MSDYSTIARAILASANVACLERDLADHIGLAAPLAVGILTEEQVAECSPTHPLAFGVEDSARAVAALLQAAHDLAGDCGRIDQGDAVTFGVIERPAAHLDSTWPVSYYIVATLVHSSETIDSATTGDALSRAEILAAACGVRLCGVRL